MKIAYLTLAQIPSHIASSVHVMKMCEAFAAVGHNVTLFCPREDGASSSNSEIYDFYGVRPVFEIRRLPRPPRIKRLKRALSQDRLLRWYLAWKSYDLVYARCHGWQFYRLHKLRLPWVAEAHILHEGEDTSSLLRHPLLRGLVVISEALAEDYSSHYSLRNLRMVVAHDGADEGLPAQPASLPGSNSIKCGYVGNLYKGAGIDIIVALAKRCPNIDFHVVGGTEEDVAPWRRELAEVNIQNLYFHGFVPPAKTAAIRLACDILVAPYQKKAYGVGGIVEKTRWMSPLKVFEYMAAGKAIVASQLPAIREILIHRKNAVLCPGDDIDAWYSALSSLADNADERRRLGENAKEDLLATYTWNARAAYISRELGFPGKERAAGL